MFTSVVPQRLSAMFSSAEPAIGAYSAALAAHPLETKVATAAALALVGDAIAQRAAAKDAPTPMTYDAKRGVSFVLFDAAYRGGFQHAAFPAIIELCRGDVLHGAADSLQLSGVLDQSMLAAIECTAVNQLVIVPVVYYPLFFAITGAVQGLDRSQSLDRVRKQFVPLTIRNWKFWIPSQFVQFAYLPLELQVPFTCVMGLAWNIILSAAAGSAREPDAEPVAESTLEQSPRLEQSPSDELVGKVVPTRDQVSSRTLTSKSKVL